MLNPNSINCKELKGFLFYFRRRRMQSISRCRSYCRRSRSMSGMWSDFQHIRQRPQTPSLDPRSSQRNDSWGVSHLSIHHQKRHVHATTSQTKTWNLSEEYKFEKSVNNVFIKCVFFSLNIIQARSSFWLVLAICPIANWSLWMQKWNELFQTICCFLRHQKFRLSNEKILISH